jgi:hypothetical protein
MTDYTANIKYLHSLSGKFTSRHRLLRLAAVLTLAAAVIFTSRLNTIVPLVISAAALLLLAVLVSYLPCSYSADECGFTICTGLISRYFNYSDINSVVVENRSCGKSGGRFYENVLTVSTDSHIYRFRENCGRVFASHNRERNVLKGHAELLKLTEFIRTRI